MPGQHSNAQAYRQMIDAADAGTRPVIDIHLGTSRSSSFRGGLVMHHVARGGPLRGAWAWPQAGQLGQFGDGTGLNGANNALNGFSVYSQSFADLSLPQSQGWRFPRVPTTGATCVAYRASGTGGDMAGFDIPRQTIRRATSEFVVVDRTFTTGSGSFTVEILPGFYNDPKASSGAISTNTGKVETRLTRVRNFFPTEGYGDSTAYLNQSTGPAFICGASIRDQAQTGGIYLAGFQHAGGRNQRHVLDTLRNIITPETVTEFVRTFVKRVLQIPFLIAFATYATVSIAGHSFRGYRQFVEVRCPNHPAVGAFNHPHRPLLRSHRSAFCSASSRFH